MHVPAGLPRTRSTLSAGQVALLCVLTPDHPTVTLPVTFARVISPANLKGFVRLEIKLLLLGATLHWQVMMMSGARTLIDLFTALRVHWPVLHIGCQRRYD